jgi:LAO/AO transport system kinase
LQAITGVVAMSEKNKSKKSALQVNKGVEQPSPLNVDAIKRFKKMRRRILEADEYADGILSHNRTILSKAITLVESSLPEHHVLAQKVIEKCVSVSVHSIRIGITGVPGVGKSTFIEALGKYLTGNGHRLAVLAIDPSSQRSKGSILGDKTRMEELSVDPDAFIRPSPTSGSLGGVTRKTRETIILCEAAGFDVIFIETVGVGQSETAVHAMVDFFLLLMLAGAGDELQGIKRGIMEMADAVVINKADGDNLDKASLAMSEYKNALHLFPPSGSGWIPRVSICSSLNKSGIEELWETITEYVNYTRDNGFFEEKRKTQNLQAMLDTINERLKDNFYSNASIKHLKSMVERDLMDSKITSYAAAQKLLETYFKLLMH